MDNQNFSKKIQDWKPLSIGADGVVLSLKITLKVEIKDQKNDLWSMCITKTEDSFLGKKQEEITTEDILGIFPDVYIQHLVLPAFEAHERALKADEVPDVLETE